MNEPTKLVLCYYPENYSVSNIEWKSSNEQIATVDSCGNVIPVGNGDVVITAKDEITGLEASAHFTVKILMKDFMFMSNGEEKESMECWSYPGAVVDLPELKLIPSNAFNDIHVRSTDTDVVKINDGKMYFQDKEGEAMVFFESLSTPYLSKYVSICNKEIRTSTGLYVIEKTTNGWSMSFAARIRNARKSNMNVYQICLVDHNSKWIYGYAGDKIYYRGNDSPDVYFRTENIDLTEKYGFSSLDEIGEYVSKWYIIIYYTVGNVDKNIKLSIEPFNYVSPY